MPFSVRLLRVLLAGAAVLLVGALAWYIVRGRMRLGNPLKGLPGRLGIDVEQESDNFTYSQSLRGRTVYTIHASKEIQHKDGQITLRDVAMELFGVKGDRNDRIMGHEFSYDQKKGILRAIGPVFIDLAPPPKAGADPQPGAKAADEQKRIHVVTSGLVFLQKEQNASTEEAVDFVSGGVTGHAVGASYDSGPGVVVLRSAVHMTGARGGRPLELTAARAELDRVGNVGLLEQAKYRSVADSGPESAAADHAVIHMDPDGTPRHIDGDGHVMLAGGGKGAVTGDHLQLDLGTTGQPRQGHLFSHVGYRDDSPARLSRGTTDDARVSFDELGRPRHVLLTGAVDLTERAAGKERQLQAGIVDLNLSGGGRQPMAIVAGRAVAAPGSQRAWLRFDEPDNAAGNAGGMLATDVRAQTLTGRFAAGARQTQLEGLDGAGQTEVARVARDARGQTVSGDTSRGDTLRLDLGPSAGPQRSGSAQTQRLELVRAEQHGHVESVRFAARKPQAGKSAEAPTHERTRAEAEIYDAASDVMTLTGGVEIENDTSALFAEHARMDHRERISTAGGSVRVSYMASKQQANAAGNASEEPVHVVAAEAVSNDATGVTVFTGGAAGKARMWQGASQIEAPELEMNRQQKTLLASAGAGGRGTDQPLVRTVLLPTALSSKQPSAGAVAKPSGPVRVLSRELLYRDSTREAVFTGRVHVQDADGTLDADQATAYMAGAQHRDAAAAPSPLGGRLDHVVGTGHVTVQQPERTGTGEKIVYTAADQTFVLTGTKTVLPKVVDEEHGMITGAVLRFRGEDKAVFVDGDGANQRVRTETKLK